MKTNSSSTRILSFLLLAASGCVTIYVNFPEKEVQEAAEKIVEEVRPDDVSAVPDSPPEEESTSSAVYSLFAPRAAHAEEKKTDKKTDKKSAKDIQINVETPVVKKIKEALKKRYPKLLPFYDKGALGERLDGYVAERDIEGLGLKEKRDLLALVKEENEDRKNLYTEIVKANNIEATYVAAVGEIFGKEWQGKAKANWWIEIEKGKWEKKKDKKK